MRSIVIRTAWLVACCVALNGCVLAVVGAAGAGGYLVANSKTLSESDTRKAPPPAPAGPPPSSYHSPQNQPAPPDAPPPAAPAYQSAPIQVVPLK